MRGAVALFLFGLLASPSLAAPAIDVQTAPCFTGMPATGGVVPFVVQIRNQGPSVSGAAVAQSGSGRSSRRYVYPLDLPSGTIKRFTIYPRPARYGEDSILSFEGGIRATTIPLSTDPSDGSRQLVGLISDRFGAISEVRAVTPRKPVAIGSRAGGQYRESQGFQDCYARPEDAPDRTAGYESLDVLVLGDGAERMSATQWSAIRRWVLGGGSLILFGGPSAAYTRMADVQPLLPVTQPHGITVPALKLRTLGSEPIPAGPYALTTGAPGAGARVLAGSPSAPTLVIGSYGLGRVLYAAFTPLEGPLKGSPVMPKLWSELLSPDAAGPLSGGIWATDREGAVTVSGRSGRPYPQAANNPFRVQLPSAGAIIFILLCYFILVVPLTYVVLKRRQRLEWAWFTSPLISITFAFVFYLFTASLYRAGLSRRTSGTLVAAAGTNEAVFRGQTEVFFPRGGSYRVTIPGLDEIEATRINSGYPMRPGSDEGLETLDAGAMTIPGFPVSNLSFKRLYHTQAVSLAGTVSARLRMEPTGGFSGTITNRTNLTLYNARVVWTGGYLYSGGIQLAPGQTGVIDGSNTWDRATFERYGIRKARPGHWSISYTDNGSTVSVTQFGNGTDLSDSPGAFITAEVAGDPFGPALGKDVGQQDAVDVVISVPPPGRNH